MSQFQDHHPHEKILQRFSSELLSRWNFEKEIYCQIDELRDELDSSKAEFYAVRQKFSPHGFTRDVLIDAAHFGEHMEQILNRLQIFCDLLEQAAKLSRENTRSEIGGFCVNNARQIIELADNTCFSLSNEVERLQEENEDLERRADTDHEFAMDLMRKNIERTESIKGWEDAYIEVYASFCRSKWLRRWKNKGWQEYVSYQMAEDFCEKVERELEEYGSISCATYSMTLLSLLDDANKDYSYSKSESFDSGDIEIIRSRRNRIYNAFLCCSSRFQSLVDAK